MRLAFAALMVMGGVAHAAELPPPPVCSDPGVLQRLDELIRVQGQPLRLEVLPIGELSTARPGAASVYPPLAHCAVRGHTTGYDTNRYGMTPVNEPFIVKYTIELRRNGLFVSLD